MSMHHATVEWLRIGEFGRKRFSRAHRWRFDGGLELPAAASEAVVPVPWTDPSAIDPEEAFIAALSSCHLQAFLFHASNDGWRVASYRDEAEGTLEGWITEVRLRPEIVFDGPQPPAEVLEALHARAHESCFIARSVKTVVKVLPPPRRAV